MSAVIRIRIRQGSGKRLKPSETRCGRQESRGVVRNPINLNFVIINSSRSLYSSFSWSSLFNLHRQWSESPNWCIFCVQVIIIAIIIMNIIIINHYERPQHHRVSLLFDFPSRQVTSSRSSVLDLLLLTKAVSKNWNFVSNFNTSRLWNRLMYDLNNCENYGQRISVENFSG